jgi:transposase InsO family protein
MPAPSGPGSEALTSASGADAGRSSPRPGTGSTATSPPNAPTSGGFPTGEGKLFVAGIRDLCHRGLVGWSMSEHHDAELVVDALVMALGRCDIDPDGLVHHSDRGSPTEALGREAG